MDEFDIENLSPEDRALFDAMVREEMMKLEMGFQQELGYENDDYPEQIPAVTSKRNEYYEEDNRNSSIRAPPRAQNHLNPHYEIDRQNRNDPYNRKKEKDIEIDIHVNGPPPKGFGQNELSREEKRAKQLEYARQLNDQAELPQPTSQRINQPRNSRAVQEEEQGLLFGRDDSRDDKKIKQREYARLLEMDQKASVTSERTSLSANSRSKSNPRVGGSYDNRRQELSSSRSDSAGRGEVAPGNVLNPRPTDERQAKIAKQRQYAQELQLQQQQQELSKQREKERESYQFDHSPTKFTPQKNSNISRSSFDPNQSEKNLKHQKQQEYAQQLASDQRKNDIARNNLPQRGERVTPRDERDLEIPYSTSPYQSGRSSSTNLSDKEIKLRKQQEYARQLEMDRMSKDRIQNNNEMDRNQRSVSSMQSPTSLASQVSQSQFPGQSSLDPRQERMQKRRDQEAYAQQIREAASKQEILSPRISLGDKRRQQMEANSRDNGTGLLLPGASISTAVRNDVKKQQQEKYRQELADDIRTNRSSHTLEADRIPLHKRNPNTYEENQGGLIGHHESEEEKRRKKKELQHKYYNDLATQQSERRDEPYDPRGLVNRGNPREIRDVSPIVSPQRRDLHRKDPYDRFGQNNYTQQDQDEMNYNPRQDYMSRDPSGSLQQLREQASQHVYADPYSYHDQDRYPSTAAAVAAASGSPYRHNKAYQYQEPKYEPELEPEPYISPKQSNQIARYQKPSSSECTGLVIGGMTVLTAEQKAERHRQQQQYARDVAEAAKAQPIHISRESYEERHRYKGNGLPGEYLPPQGYGGGSFSDRNPPPQERNEGGYRHRGTSNGGGVSSISFGGGESEVSPHNQRMQRRGKQEEYAAQLRQQMNYNVSQFHQF